MARVLAPLLVLLALAGCAPRVTIPDAERERVSSELDGRLRYLRVAAFVAPLFGDHAKLLVSDQPLGELDLLETGDGQPIRPPPAEKVLAPGTPVRIARVEFPTPWLIAKRVVMTPRQHPWAYLEVANDPRPYVVVLSQTAASYDDVRVDLDRLLSADDPTAAFTALPPEQRDAVLKKELVEGMSPRAVEMAWGQPERRRIDRPTSTEDWTWPGAKRKASFQDDRLVRWEPR